MPLTASNSNTNEILFILRMADAQVHKFGKCCFCCFYFYCLCFCFCFCFCFYFYFFFYNIFLISSLHISVHSKLYFFYTLRYIKMFNSLHFNQCILNKKKCADNLRSFNQCPTQQYDNIKMSRQAIDLFSSNWWSITIQLR